VLFAVIPAVTGLGGILDNQWTWALLIIAGALWLIQSLLAICTLHIALRALTRALKIAREREAGAATGEVESPPISNR